MDLLELFEREAPERGHRANGQPRKGLRGLFDRLSAVLDGDAEEPAGRRDDRERRRRGDEDIGFD